MVSVMSKQPRVKTEQKKQRGISTCALMTLSFFVPVLIMALAYAGKGIYPGGPYTVLIMDMKSQYMPFYASLRYIGNSDNSLFFSMSGALGNNFFGTFAYYLSNPLVWLSVLVPLEYLPDYIYFLTLFKIGACGAGFCYFLSHYKTNPDAEEESRKYPLMIFLLSCCYALMSYNVTYAMNLMWLDGVLLLPWIIAGMERILGGKKPTMFLVSVALSMICNYYITFMSAVFAVLYLAVRLTELHKWNLKLLGRFTVSAVLGVGIPCPSYCQVSSHWRRGRSVKMQMPCLNCFVIRFGRFWGSFCPVDMTAWETMGCLPSIVAS